MWMLRHDVGGGWEATLIWSDLTRTHVHRHMSHLIFTYVYSMCMHTQLIEQ